jgi:hypothetical protein
MKTMDNTYLNELLAKAKKKADSLSTSIHPNKESLKESVHSEHEDLRGTFYEDMSK